MLWERLEKFLFPSRSGTWITILRVGLGLQVTIYALSLWRDWNYLFATNPEGLINRDLSEAILTVESPLIPRLGWFVTLGGKAGLTEAATLTFAWGCLFCSGLCLLAGFLSRPAAVVAWIVHLAARSSGGFTTYGVDHFMTIGLFYLSIAPLPDSHSLDRRLTRAAAPDPHRIGFHQRVLQIHLCLIYFFSGLAKCIGSGWWEGTSMWRALTRPPFNVVDPTVLLQWNHLLPAAGIVICVLEVVYPILIWPKLSRSLWLASVLTMHIGIGLLMGLYLFSLIMIILNIAAFGPGIELPGWPARLIMRLRNTVPNHAV